MPSPDTVRFVHVKRGTTYTVVGVATGQSDCLNEPDMIENENFVVYRADKDGKLWVRPQSEFLDGRFKEI